MAKSPQKMKPVVEPVAPTGGVIRYSRAKPAPAKTAAASIGKGGGMFAVGQPASDKTKLPKHTLELIAAGFQRT